MSALSIAPLAMLNRHLLYSVTWKFLIIGLVQKTDLLQVFIIVALCTHRSKYIFRLQCVEHVRILSMITSRILNLCLEVAAQVLAVIQHVMVYVLHGRSLVCGHAAPGLGGSLTSRPGALCPSLVQRATPACSEDTREGTCLCHSLSSHSDVAVSEAVQGPAHSRCSINAVEEGNIRGDGALTGSS